MMKAAGTVRPPTGGSYLVEGNDLRNRAAVDGIDIVRRFFSGSRTGLDQLELHAVGNLMVCCGTHNLVVGSLDRLTRDPVMVLRALNILGGEAAIYLVDEGRWL